VKAIKMLGLAAVAAISAMALFGASSAMATFDTALCSEKSPELKCPDAKLVKHVHLLAEDGTMVTSVGTTLCKYALISTEVLGLGKPLLLHFLKEGLTYTECKLGLIKCTFETVHYGLLDLLKTASDLGVLTDLPVEGKYTEVHVVCGELIDCTYKWEGLEGHALSAQPPTSNGRVTYTNAPVQKVGGLLCPKETRLNAVFESLPGAPIWIRS
jgi:hypothetical protein